jgi:hypothetical protein
MAIAAGPMVNLTVKLITKAQSAARIEAQMQWVWSKMEYAAKWLA